MNELNGALLFFKKFYLPGTKNLVFPHLVRELADALDKQTKILYPLNPTYFTSSTFFKNRKKSEEEEKKKIENTDRTVGRARYFKLPKLANFVKSSKVKPITGGKSRSNRNHKKRRQTRRKSARKYK